MNARARVHQPPLTYIHKLCNLINGVILCNGIEGDIPHVLGRYTKLLTVVGLESRRELPKITQTQHPIVLSIFVDLGLVEVCGRSGAHDRM